MKLTITQGSLMVPIEHHSLAAALVTDAVSLKMDDDVKERSHCLSTWHSLSHCLSAWHIQIQ